jgi:hypothetical protein
MTAENMKEDGLDGGQWRQLAKVIHDAQEWGNAQGNFLTWAAHVMMFNDFLVELKSLSRILKAEVDVDNLENPIILHPERSGESEMAFGLAKLIFLMLDEAYRQDDPYQLVAGARVNEVNAINLQAVGIPYIVPRDLETEGSICVVSLQDLDQFRLTEMQRLSQQVAGDQDSIRSIKQILGGYVNGPIIE